MKMSFRDSFWGPHGFEDLRKSVKEGQDFTKEIASILHERSELENNYAKNLLKLSAKMTKVTKFSFGSTQHVWQEIAVGMENEAESHKQLSIGLEEDVAKPMKGLLECQHKNRKCLENAVDKAARALNDRRNDESKSKKLSYTCAKENERMQEQTVDTKANRGKIITEKDIHKLECKRRKAEESLAKADIDYYSASIKAERARQDWESTVYRACGAFQQLEEQRLNGMHDFVQKYCNHLVMLSPSLGRICERLNTAVGSVDVNSDVQTMIEVKGTGPNVPEQILPDFYAENMNNEMKNERRKEFLEKFLKVLKHDLELERKGKQGVENLAKVFQETPTFGDADAQQDVFDKLQHMRAMLAYLEATRYKLQSALAELEGRPKPTHPLLSHMEIKNKQGIHQTVLKIPNWVRLGRRNSESSGSSSSDTHEFVTSQINGNSNEVYQNASEHTNGDVSRIHCQALYEYEAKFNDELTLQTGDVIVMVQKRDDGWWFGELNGRTGLFPSTYVQEL